MSLPLSESTLPHEEERTSHHKPGTDIKRPEIEASMISESIPVVETRSRKKYIRLITVTVRIGCTLALLAYAFAHNSWAGILQNLRRVDDGELLIGWVVGLLGVVISSYQWQSLLEAEKMRFDLRKLINYYLIGITFNNFLPTGMGGDVVKAYYTGKESQNMAGAASAVMTSRITGFIGMLLIAFPTLLIWHTLFPETFISSFVFAGLAMSCALITVFFVANLLPRHVKGRWAEQSLVRSILNVSHTLHKGMKRPRSMCTAVAYGMLFHTSAALNYYSIALMFNIHIPFAFFLVAIPFVSLIAVLPISINGYGLREETFVHVLSIMHISPSTALAMVLVFDAQMLVFALIGACIYFSMRKSKTTRPTHLSTEGQQGQPNYQ